MELSTHKCSWPWDMKLHIYSAQFGLCRIFSGFLLSEKRVWLLMSVILARGIERNNKYHSYSKLWKLPYHCFWEIYKFSYVCLLVKIFFNLSFRILLLHYTTLSYYFLLSLTAWTHHKSTQLSFLIPAVLHPKSKTFL